MSANIANELALLNAEADARPIAEMKAAEEHFADYIVKEATLSEDGTWWSILTTDSTGFGFEVRDGGPDPERGSSIRTYGRFGFEIHGIDVDGSEVFWRTPWERMAKRIQWLADYDRRKREEFVDHQAQTDADYEALPAPLRRRIDRFRREDASFRIDSERYEMFTCVEAAKIAEYLRPLATDDDVAEVIAGFHKDVTAQAACGISLEHSGNTFGGACSLAGALLDGSLAKFEADQLAPSPSTAQKG